MSDLFVQNPSVVFYILGGIGTIIAMIVGVLLIRRRSKQPKTTESYTTSTATKKKKEK